MQQNRATQSLRHIHIGKSRMGKKEASTVCHCCIVQVRQAIPGKFESGDPTYIIRTYINIHMEGGEALRFAGPRTECGWNLCDGFSKLYRGKNNSYCGWTENELKKRGEHYQLEGEGSIEEEKRFRYFTPLLYVCARLFVVRVHPCPVRLRNKVATRMHQQPQQNEEKTKEQ